MLSACGIYGLAELMPVGAESLEQMNTKKYKGKGIQMPSGCSPKHPGRPPDGLVISLRLGFSQTYFT